MSKILKSLNKKSEQGYDSPEIVHDELVRTFFSRPEKKTRKQKIPKARIIIFAALIAFTIAGWGMFLAKAPSVEAVSLVENGVPEAYFVSDVFFSGDADKFSRERDGFFLLINSGGNGWGNLTIEFKTPINMKRADIIYRARGQVGGENMLIVLMDSRNRSYRMRKDLSSSLTAEFSDRRVNLRPARGAVDLSDIAAIKLEFGSLTAGNGPGATIFLKDVRITEVRAEQWF